ncbi:hypothetical protein BSKO_02576 [Bryopsis sp. KO-2023]|nr:hypothetical protein BSKO_02576 [Bryopsis sp. KO-2023]
MFGRVDAARRNNSWRATFDPQDRNKPFASGAFRWVAKGTYCGGGRDGEACVLKWFKTGCVFSDTYFSMDIKATNKAIEIVQKWNDERLVDRIVRVNEAQVWVSQDPCPGPGYNNRDRRPGAGERCLVEPFIENYQKFNSNSGWCDRSSPWPRVMQALSHYSYHISKGELLLCDLQGGCYQNGVVLTDPVIMSNNRRYGVTDLGSEGISNFFANHRCNEYCRSHWLKIEGTRKVFRKVRGTTMRPYRVPYHVPTRHERNLMSVQENRQAVGVLENRRRGLHTLVDKLWGRHPVKRWFQRIFRRTARTQHRGGGRRHRDPG